MSISISMYMHIQKMKPETSVQVVPMLENHTVVTKVVLQVVFNKAFPAFPLPPTSVFFRSLPHLSSPLTFFHLSLILPPLSSPFLILPGFFSSPSPLSYSLTVFTPSPVSV